MTHTDAPGEATTAKRLAERDRSVLVHPYLGSETHDRIVVTRGSGSEIWDADGRRYLDATGGLWLAQIGHGREELAAVASKQMADLEYFMSFWDYTNRPAIECAEKLVSIAPDGIGRVFFTSGGSEGNEAAIKAARYYHWRRGATSRNWILSRTQAYHGLGYGSGSLSGFTIHHDGFAPMMPNVHHLTPPWPYREELYAGEDVTDYCVRELEQTIQKIGAENIAAMIGEPIMGVAGMIIPPDDYWPRVQQLLHENGILLILDEVVTAYGRVGRWFAAEHFSVQPDLITTAKGITSGYIPFGALLMTDEVADTITSGDGFPMGFTYSGHPVAAAVALENLAIIERENLLERATTSGGYLRSLLDQLLEFPIVGEVRSIGMMLAVELVSDRATRRPHPGVAEMVSRARREHGLIVRDSGHNIVLSPPLTMTVEEGVEIFQGLHEVIKASL